MTPFSHRSTIERLLPVGLLVALVMITMLTIYPLLPAVLWGAVLAVAAESSYRRLTLRLDGRRLLAAWIIGLALALIIIVPAVGLARALLAFLPDALNWLERLASSNTSATPGGFHELPAIGPLLGEIWQSLFGDARGTASHFQDELKMVFIWALHEAEVLGVFVFELAIGVVLAVVLMFHAERVSDVACKFFDRIGGRFAQRLALHSVVTTRHTVRGVLGAALAQTLVATFSYVVAGLPGWLILTGITFVLSLIQVGPALVWAPAAIWLWASGQPGMATFVFFWGLIVVTLTDNIARPMLVSKGSNLPATLAFIGAVGGLLAWGVIGVFLGPVIVAVAYELILKWLEPDTLPEEILTDTSS